MGESLTKSPAYTKEPVPPRPLSRGAMVVWLPGALAPFFCAVVWVPWLLWRWWEIGVSFQRGLHGMLFMLHLMILLGLIVGSLLLWGIVSAAAHRKVPVRAGRVVIGLNMLATAALILSFGGAVYAFRAGRDTAYARLDLPQLAAEAQALAASCGNVEGRGVYVHYLDSDPSYTQLPMYISALNPMAVGVNADVVVIRMDGGGPTAREGVLIRVSGEVPQRVLTNLIVLDADLGVYRFLSTDERVFLDPVEQVGVE